MAVAFASTKDTVGQKAKVQELGPDVYGYISPSDPNCGFIVGDDAVLVVDTRATPSMAREWIDDIRKVTDKPIRYIFLTHYHAVRVMGAGAFNVDAIFSSRGTRELVVERGQADFDSEVQRFPRLFKGVEEVRGLTVPRATFDTEMSFWLGKREVRFMHLGRGHTKGDSVCWIPDCSVLFSGDLVENRTGIYCGDAYVREWPQTLERLKMIGAQTVVFGRGTPARTTADARNVIDAHRDYLLALWSSVEKAVKGGADIRGCFQAVDREVSPRYRDWPVYDHCVPFNVQRVVDELAGIDQPRIWTKDRDAALWAAIHG